MDEYFNERRERVVGVRRRERGGLSWCWRPTASCRELTADQIDELTAMELDLWKADQACQEEAGYADYIKQSEQDLVDRLVSEFPELGN